MVTRKKVLDLAQVVFPGMYTLEGADLAREVEKVARVMVLGLQREGLIRANASFGLMVANPQYAGNFYQVWDNPKELMGFAISWGSEGHRYVANALRKLRAAARTSCDTLVLECDSSRDFESGFRGVVASREDDGTMRWGDYPYGGACFAGEDNLQWLVGVSALEPTEDDMVAAAVARYLYGRFVQLSGLNDD